MEMQIKIQGIEKIQRDLHKIGQSLENTGLLQKTAVYAKSIMLPRISSGRDVNNAKFPPYSRKPMYISGEVPGYGRIKNSPRGKTGKTRFRSGKKHKSRYFPGGYAEFRQYMGRNVDSDRLIFTGRMLSAMQVKMVSNGAVIYFDGDEQNAKAVGNQKRYNFFGLTKQERISTFEFLRRQYEQIMQGVING